MNRIVFTQDLKGERTWLAKNFPEHINLETVHCGKWPSVQPMPGPEKYLYEISYGDQAEDIEFLNYPIPKYKSIFSNDTQELFKGKWWTISDFILHELEFFNKQKSNNYIILNLARSGTHFAKSLFDLKFQEYKQHESIGTFDRNLELYELIKNEKLTAVLVYRKDSWGWCTSNIIAHRYGFYHYNTYENSKVEPFYADEQEIHRLLEIQLSTWNFWCNLKCSIPDLNCYLLEFSETISKYHHLSEHIKVPYFKDNIILNYYELKNIFESKYKKYFDKIIMNGANHLMQMFCKTDLSDLDLVHSSSII